MAKSNHGRVGDALELLNRGLRPFVERELQAVHGDQWQEMVAQTLREDRGAVKATKKGELNWDTHNLLTVMWDQWNAVFRNTLGHTERSLVSELREVRNRWAHQTPFSSDDAYRALDSIGRLLTAISAPEAKELEEQKMALLRVRFDEQRRGEMRKHAVAPTEGNPQSGLKPWREVVTPHRDVASGKYQQAEFAADLWQVYLGEAASEYQDPTEFFRRTFITEGLQKLLSNGVRRIGGQGGDPVVELQTNFGGGKTHSMLALYHLFSGTPSTELPGTEQVLKEAGCEVASKVRRAIVVGTKVSPGNPSTKDDGTVIRTIWGEIAWQLGGKTGYEMIRADDEKATNPGDKMKELFNKFSPCLVLIDEWVAYARQLHEGSLLPAGTFDTQFTFAQALSEAAKAAKNTLLVVSIPASDNEIGGEWGQRALSRLKNAIGRVESSWRPASPDEGFEIVRRRLFEPLHEKQAFVARDAVARAFVEMYGTQHSEFPSECREAEYERRIKLAYPIHPELFDRLYNDWSTLDKFQRTRGVLRLMAAVIHSLWERQDGNLLIMPATIPIDDPAVQFELTRYLDDQWTPVIAKDVDGEHSLPLRLDRDAPNLGRYSACRRVARTIYVGSAPTQRAANRGIDDRQVKLGCVQPGETVATFGDAIRRLTDRATYLYVDGSRYWYSTQPTVTRLAEDRANQLHEHDVMDEIVRRLRDEARSRGDFHRVHVCLSSSDILDEHEARLVVLGPEHPHSKGQADSAARKEAQAILDSRGSSPRSYKNTLVFLAGDASRLKDLQTAIRQFLAWKSIWDEREQLNLDPFQSKQADTKRKNADDTVNVRIPEAYQWLLVPNQPDPKGSPEWTETRLQGSDSLALRASKKLKSEEMLLVQMGGVRLRLELDRVPLWRGNDVLVKQLVEDFATYLYLPRLRDSDVLIAAIREGITLLTWQSETFAYAQSKDADGRYLGLVGGGSAAVQSEGGSIVVKPDVAAEQQRRDAEAAKAKAGNGSATVAESERTGEQGQAAGAETTRGADTDTPPPPAPTYRRFHGSVQLDSLRVGRDASRIADEVIQHLSKYIGANVEVTLEIRAEMPDGATEKTIRDVTENCRTLRFDSFGFEEE
ncbi:Swt1 family HEPN domain-containing protein [Syntrophorhabdus aromaticivorans]|jgi:predicted AAA+ superfamily ATPase|uniref:Swt1 family HEPN domain-containing protein n=2 Tax=Pseudomonadati TaxID=3379134 RepID=UPI00042455D8|nr:Swt1 family HEPN domain-containing protein [Syntrophorhabdus aromaticivorans]MDI9379266.1 Swt1 family HEPN domain-containing protein [Verrucomicrobiota bacterium]NLI08217.1 ATP-binding protein [Thermotogaceae bacterium]